MIFKLKYYIYLLNTYFLSITRIFHTERSKNFQYQFYTGPHILRVYQKPVLTSLLYAAKWHQYGYKLVHAAVVSQEPNRVLVVAVL